MNAEERRQEAIEGYELREGLVDPALDDVARLAAQVCVAPVGGIAIVGRGEPFLAGMYGLGLRTLAADALPLTSTMAAERAFELPDSQGKGTGQLQVGE